MMAIPLQGKFSLRRAAPAVAAALCAALAAGAAPAADVTVQARGLRSKAGQVLVAVCTARTFLKRGCPYTGRAPAASGRVTVRGVPPGVYAVQIFHDENANNDLDRNALGFPLEGAGFSRDAPMRFGPPTFSDAAVEIPPGGGTLNVTMRYFR